jgi:hypothetical protein
MPLRPLSEAQQRIILTLANPLPRAVRDRFYLEVALAIMRLPEVDDGVVHRTAAALQRQYFDVPNLDGELT